MPTVKLVLRKLDSSIELRRIQVDELNGFDIPSLKCHFSSTFSSYKSQPESFTISYFDDEDDEVTVSTERELLEGIQIMEKSGKALKFFISPIKKEILRRMEDTEVHQGIVLNDSSSKTKTDSFLTESTKCAPRGPEAVKHRLKYLTHQANQHLRKPNSERGRSAKSQLHWWNSADGIELRTNKEFREFHQSVNYSKHRQGTCVICCRECLNGNNASHVRMGRRPNSYCNTCGVSLCRSRIFKKRHSDNSEGNKAKRLKEMTCFEYFHSQEQLPLPKCKYDNSEDVEDNSNDNNNTLKNIH